MARTLRLLLALLVLEGLEKLQRRSKVGDDGYDAVGVVVVNCKNDGTVIDLVSTSPPAPDPVSDFDYSRFVRRIGQLYGTRVAKI